MRYPRFNPPQLGRLAGEQRQFLAIPKPRPYPPGGVPLTQEQAAQQDWDAEGGSMDAPGRWLQT